LGGRMFKRRATSSDNVDGVADGQLASADNAPGRCCLDVLQHEVVLRWWRQESWAEESEGSDDVGVVEDMPERASQGG